MSISEQEHQRRESLEDIIQLGLNPYPSESFEINIPTFSLDSPYSQQSIN